MSLFIFFLAGFFLFSCNAIAQSPFTSEDELPGSQFNTPTFVDTHFEKFDYRELQPTGRSGVTPWMQKKGNLFPTDGNAAETLRSSSKKFVESQGIVPAGAKEEDIAGRVGSENLAEVTGMTPVYDVSGDWVPDALNLTSNGGFGDAPFNGAPVPYNLNGHVDIQRGRP